MADADLPTVPYIRSFVINGVVVNILVDTGAFDTLISISTLDKTYGVGNWRDKISRKDCARMKFSLADGSKASGPIGRIELPMEIQGRIVTVSAWVLATLNVDMIIGARTFDNLGAVIDFPNRCVHFRNISNIDPVTFVLRRSRTP